MQNKNPFESRSEANVQQHEDTPLASAKMVEGGESAVATERRIEGRRRKATFAYRLNAVRSAWGTEDVQRSQLNAAGTGANPKRG
jgi:hypothetical protein